MLSQLGYLVNGPHKLRVSDHFLIIILYICIWYKYFNQLWHALQVLYIVCVWHRECLLTLACCSPVHQISSNHNIFKIWILITFELFGSFGDKIFYLNSHWGKPWFGSYKINNNHDLVRTSCSYNITWNDVFRYLRYILIKISRVQWNAIIFLQKGTYRYMKALLADFFVWKEHKY